MESGARDGAVVISGSGLMVRVWSSGFRSVFERGLGRVFPSILFPILRYLRCISAPASVVNASEIAMGSQVLPGLGAGHSLPHSRSSPGSSTNSRFETFRAATYRMSRAQTRTMQSFNVSHVLACRA